MDTIGMSKKVRIMATLGFCLVLIAPCMGISVSVSNQCGSIGYSTLADSNSACNIIFQVGKYDVVSSCFLDINGTFVANGKDRYGMVNMGPLKGKIVGQINIGVSA